MCTFIERILLTAFTWVLFFFASDDSCITSLFSSIAIIIITTVVLDFSFAYAFNCGDGFFFFLIVFIQFLLSMLTVESYLMNL